MRECKEVLDAFWRGGTSVIRIFQAEAALKAAGNASSRPPKRVLRVSLPRELFGRTKTRPEEGPNASFAFSGQGQQLLLKNTGSWVLKKDQNVSF